MSARPSTAEKSTSHKGRQRSGDETSEDAERRPLNLGCGTLLVLFLAVATAGKFLPHGDKAVKPIAKPATAPLREPIMESERKPAPDKAPIPAIASKPAPPLPKTAKPKPVASGAPAGQIDKLLRELGLWLGYPDLPLTAPAAAKQPLNARQPDKPPRAAPKTLPSGQPTATPRDAPVPVGKAVTRPEKPSPADSNKPKAPLAGSVPPSPVPAPAAALVATSPALSAAAPAPGKAVVFNSPWNQSVEQVERYLRRHAHNADSIEVLEWGQVARVGQGYQVRCTFRSRNVLGKVATQSKVFVLDRDGEVTDILD